MKYWFWGLFGIDALVAAIFVYFFFVGLGDGSVSSFNGALWLGILTGLAAVLGGSFFLKRAGQNVLALCLLGLLAIPALLAALFFAVILISNPRWN